MVELDSWTVYEWIGALIGVGGLYVAFTNRSLFVGAVSLFLLLFVYAHYERRGQLLAALDRDTVPAGPGLDDDPGNGAEAVVNGDAPDGESETTGPAER